MSFTAPYGALKSVAFAATSVVAVRPEVPSHTISDKPLCFAQVVKGLFTLCGRDVPEPPGLRVGESHAWHLVELGIDKPDDVKDAGSESRQGCAHVISVCVLGGRATPEC